eukprot:3100925-Pyramimonas_sp.AAC.1
MFNPTFLELLVRRWNWLAQIVRCPLRRAQIVAAFFAELPTDQRPRYDCMMRVTAHANPWARFF